MLAGGALGVAALGLPARALGETIILPPAQPFSISEQHRRILAVAKEQMERQRARLWRTDLVGVADFGLPSSLPRFHFADLEKGAVRSFLVSHGRGSDPEHDGFLKTFSNVEGSLATSRGAFVTYEWYKGKYGTSIRLGGVDPDNSNALPRAIVVHPAWYANPTCWPNGGSWGAATAASPWQRPISTKRCGTFRADD